MVFESQKVPKYVCYSTVITRWSRYRKHFDVCKPCFKVGHRRDVCPKRNVKVCFDCAVNNPAESREYERNPKCKLCEIQRPTCGIEYKNKYNIPYVVMRRQWEHKIAEQRVKQQLAPGEFPPLLTSAGASGTANRHESRSRGDKTENRNLNRNTSRRGRSQSEDTVYWAEAAKLGEPRVKDLQVWHWSCHGFAGKKSVLQQHLEQLSRFQI